MQYIYTYIYIFILIYLTVDLGPLYFHIPESISTKVMISSSAVLKRLGLTDVSKDLGEFPRLAPWFWIEKNSPAVWNWMVQIDGN